MGTSVNKAGEDLATRRELRTRQLAAEARARHCGRGALRGRGALQQKLVHAAVHGPRLELRRLRELWRHRTGLCVRGEIDSPRVAQQDQNIVLVVERELERLVLVLDGEQFLELLGRVNEHVLVNHGVHARAVDAGAEVDDVFWAQLAQFNQFVRFAVLIDRIYSVLTAYEELLVARDGYLQRIVKFDALIFEKSYLYLVGLLTTDYVIC